MQDMRFVEEYKGTTSVVYVYVAYHFLWILWNWATKNL